MEYTNVTGYKNGIFCVESGYAGGGVASVYIIAEGRNSVIVDTAHSGAIRPVMSAMNEIGLSGGDVAYILLTHVHLDHSGGAGAFAKEFPNARVVVHERGARHLIDPGRLVAGTAEVYGRERMDSLYGEVLPVAADRIHSPKHGEEIRIGNRVLVCLDTPGHASHHLAYHDAAARAVFSGDVYGLSYLELTRPEGRCAIAATAPVQFDPDAMMSSMRLIESLHPEYLYPTHFGRMPLCGALSDSLHRQIALSVKIARDAGGDAAKMKEPLWDMFIMEAGRQGFPNAAANFGPAMKETAEVNVQGLAVWYRKNHNVLN